jgi:glycosyltransferase involved in cell wall biosynthesis
MRATLVHLVIPAYNEGRRLLLYLPPLCEALAKASFPWRITVADDGSDEDDSRKMQECVRLCGPHLRFHRLPVNVGKGGAVYTGLGFGLRIGMARTPGC